MTFESELDGHGSSTLAIARSLSGAIGFYMRGGRMRDSGLRFLFGSVLYELLDAVNPFSKRQDYIDIDCVGAYFDLDLRHGA